MNNSNEEDSTMVSDILDNPYFKAALTIIQAEMPDLYTTKGLATLLHNYWLVGLENENPSTQRRVKIESLRLPRVYWGLFGSEVDAEPIIRRIAADPAGWAIDEDQEVSDGAEYYKKFADFGMNSAEVGRIMTHHIIRDHIQALQQSMGISALSDRTLSLFDSEITIKGSESQLYVMPSDLPILRESSQKAFDWAIATLKQRLNDYTIEEEIEYDKNYRDDANFAEIEALKPRIVYCSLGSSSHDWQGNDDTGYTGIPCDRDAIKDPDRIDLYLGFDDLIVGTGESVNSTCFTFYRKDESVIRCFAA